MPIANGADYLTTLLHGFDAATIWGFAEIQFAGNFREDTQHIEVYTALTYNI